MSCRHLFNWLPSRTVRRTKRAKTLRRLVRPRLEGLEDRTLLATLVVSPGGVVPGSFSSIQAAVNAAAPTGDTILVDPGTYTEQVTINKSLTLQGNGAGAILQSPTTLTPDAFGLNVLVEVNNAATVDINNMTVEGPNSAIDEGILVVGGATANVTGSTIADINQGQANFGNQTGIAIQVGGTDTQAVGQVGQATIADCTITDYQLGGIIIGENGSSGTLTGNTITGIGPTSLIVQNGIQIDPESASATVSNNTISGNEYTGEGSGADPTSSTQAAGILNFIDSSSITGNKVFGNDVGIESTNLGDTNAGTTISGNTVQNNGFEGIVLDAGTATVSNNTITGNNIGVAVVDLIGDDTNAVGNIVSNNITNNGNGSVAFPGGGIVLLVEPDSEMMPQVTANFNRIVGNLVGLDNQAGLDEETENPVDATNNWWGSNAGPGGAGSDTVNGPVDFSPWLLLQVTASPTSLLPGGVATVVADLTTNSDGVDTSALGHVPDGIPVSFAATLGAVNPTVGTTASGKALATFTAGATPGTATVFATVDNQTSNAPITIEPAATTIQLTTLHIVPNLSNLTAQVTLTAQVSNPAGTVTEGVVTFTLAGVSVQGTVQNGTVNAQVVIPLQDLASNLAVQLTASVTYADNSTPSLFAPGNAVMPVVFNVWNALLPSVVTFTAGGGEQNVIPFLFAPLEFFYVNQQWTAFQFGPLALQVQYTTFDGIVLLTLNGLPQQVLFFGSQSQFLGAVTLALGDTVPTLTANTSGLQFLDAVVMALSSSDGPTLLLSDSLGQLAGTVS